MKLNETIQQIIPCSCNTILPGKLERIIETIHVYSNTSGIKYCDIKFIDDKLLREKIQPLANNNIHITQASYLMLFYTWNKIPFPKAGIQKNINQSAGINFSYNVQNTYLALDAGLKIAAAEKINAILIEDLHYKQIDRLLKFKQNGWRSVAFLALSANEHQNNKVTIKKS